MNIVSFSGGKDSTAMLLMMFEKNIKVDRIICVDTTKEFPDMYKHINKVQDICPIEIEVIKIDFDYYFSHHIKTRGKRIGDKGYGWPDFRNRWCTALKRQVVQKIQKTIDEECVQFHGIAFDEIGRSNNNKGRSIQYPLIEWQISGIKALEYCYSKGLDWGGLYEKFHRVSCYCCPLSRIGELRVLYNDFPQLWDRLCDMDKKSFRKFRSDYTLDQLTCKFKNENIK